VLAVRSRLAESPWAQIGAEAIAWELEKLGGPVPPVRTIEEILARAGVTQTGRVSRRRTSKGLPYPAPAAKRVGDVVQADLIGPRHLDGGVRFHALTQIDVASHHAGIEIITDRGDQRVLGALYALWERHGLPRRLQLDNGGPFVSPTGLGEVVRVCLHQQVTLVFIPPREPWRNGTIEHFNNTFQQRFFRQERFDGLPHLIERTLAFERFHNSQHRYKASGGRTPQQSTPAKPRTPRPASEIPTGWPEHGRIEFIRFIRSDLRLRIFGRAIPDARWERLQVRHRHARPLVHRGGEPARQRHRRTTAHHRPAEHPTPPVRTPSDDAPGVSHSASSYGLRYMRNPRYKPSPGKRCARGDPSPSTVNDVLAAVT
jgi:putative transposase